ncbi:MAG TPA: hypothetical protein VFS59_01370 [Gemmatimonadaceae bacterium]|nr:hypothetical protein [Gemmatimonadaceae bacterium]
MSLLCVATPLVVTLIAPSSVVAQAATSRYAITMEPIAPPLAPTAAAADDDGPSTAGRVLRAVVGVGVGAAVGGWLGYFGAQVANSDWERISPAEKTTLRQDYTRAGVGVGGIVGYFLRPKGRTVSRLPQPLNVPPRTGRLLLASAELRRSIATNVLEAVELGRPEWTKQQRDDEAKRGGQPSTLAVESISLVVYVGDEKVGAIETLRDIAIPEVAELRFYDARDARRRWGLDHKYGAIEVVPAATTSAVVAQPVGVVNALVR